MAHGRIKHKMSACDIYRAMLERPPAEHNDSFESQAWMPPSMDMILPLPLVFKTYAKDTNDLLRSKFACQEDLFVSPLSTHKTGLFYTQEKNFEAQLNEANRLDKAEADRKSKGWWSRIKG